MIAIVVSNGQITVGSTTFNSLKYEARVVNGVIFVRSTTLDQDILYQGAAADVTLNGTSYGTENEFAIAFNAAIISANLGVNVGRNTSYPDTPFSATITANIASRVANYAKPGWVTIKALSTNGGSVYVGPTGLSASSGTLESGESVTYEVSDLSTIWALNVAAGYVINVFGAYKN